MLQIFVVFHKKIFDNCYSDVPQEILDKYFTFIAVNEKIPKEYDREKYNVINEWELPIYDPSFQERGYNENSALYHVYVNQLYKPYQYIGFCQYDMVFSKDTIDDIVDNIQEDICFSICDRTFIECIQAIERNTTGLLLNYFQQYFNKKFSGAKTYPLNNTFVISTKFFSGIMMPWVTQLYDKFWPWASTPPFPSHAGYIGEIYERASGYVLGEFYNKFKPIKLKHDWPNLKNQL
jgi:hypothetical protein